MIAVGRYLQLNADSIDWVEKMNPDSRISFQRSDIASTGLPDSSVSLASLCLVLHELPLQATTDAFKVPFSVLYTLLNRHPIIL